MSLKEGQYQIGDFVFGVGTQAVISSFERTGYTVAPGDYSVPMTDEVRFRKDYIQPATILMTVSAMNNEILDNFDEGLDYPEMVSGAEVMEEFLKEWRADEIREQWGYVKPLSYKRLGQVRRVYGRPRDVAATPRRQRTGWYDMVCSYQCSDTFSYSDEEFSSGVVLPTTSPTMGGTIERGDGKAPTWIDVYVEGPIVNPKMVVGPHTIDLNYTLAAGEVLHVSSYPWNRRCVATAGSVELNVSPRMIGDSPYLSDLRFPAGVSWSVALRGTGTTAATKMLVNWREAYHSM